jgi:hypothetical protein
MRSIALIIVALFCLNLNGQKGKLFLSRWHAPGTEEAGMKPEDYSYYEKGKYYYSISNDNNSIYIDLRIADKGSQLRILKQGLIIWIDMDARLTKKMGIRFPIGSAASRGSKKSELPNDKFKNNSNTFTLLASADKIELIGFTGEEIRRIPANNSDNFRGSVTIDYEGVLHYELIMPSAKLPLRNDKKGEGTMPFNLAIEYGPSSDQNSLRAVLLRIKNLKLVTDK